MIPHPSSERLEGVARGVSDCADTARMTLDREVLRHAPQRIPWLPSAQNLGHWFWMNSGLIESHCSIHQGFMDLL